MLWIKNNAIGEIKCKIENKLLIFMSHDSCHVWITWDLIAWYIVSYLCEQPIMTWKNTDIFLFEKFIFNFPDSNW